MQNQLVEVKRDLVIHKITGLLLDALEQNLLTAETGATIAGFILEKKPTIVDQESLNKFMDDLVAEWDTFADYITLQKNKDQNEGVDEKKLMEIKSQLAHLAGATN